MNAFTFPSQSAIFKQTVASIGNVGEIGGPAGPLDGSGKIPSSQIDLSSLTDLLVGHIIDATAYGMDTANADNSDEFEDACAAAIAADWTLLVPPGRFTFTANVFVNFEGRLRILSFGGTTFVLNASINIRALASTVTALSADVARGDIFVTLDDVTDIEIGDRLHIDTDENIETAWGYDRQCTRNVAAISGNTIRIDEKLFFPFWTADSGAVVDTYKRAECWFNGIDIECASGKLITFKGLSKLVAGRDAKATGPARKWLSPTFADGVTVSLCDQVQLYFDQKYMRYSPNMICSRNVDNLYYDIEGIRHPDANTWSEHIRYYHVRGRDTENLHQCHPSIDVGFIECQTQITDNDSNVGIDLRCMGGFIQGGSADSDPSLTSDGLGGENANNLVGLDATFLAIAAEETRRISDFETGSAIPAAGEEGLFIIERSVFPRLGATNNRPVQIDERTRLIHDDERTGSTFNNRIPVPYVVDAPVSTGYISNGSTLDVTAVIVNANGGLTVSGSAPSDGTIIFVDGLSGATQGNNRYYETVNASGSDFEILDPDTGDPIDTTAWTTYTSGGKVTPQTVVPSVDAARVPCLGFLGRLQFRARVAELTTGSTTYSGTLKSRFLAYANLPSTPFGGSVTVEAKNRSGWSRAEYPFSLIYQQSGNDALNVGTKIGQDVGSVVATATFTKHFRGSVVTEGAGTTPAVQSSRSHRYYIKIDWQVTVPNSTYATTIDLIFSVDKGG